MIGAAVGGLAGAIWADNDRDGRADGYVHNGQYYQGSRPAMRRPDLRPPRLRVSAANGATDRSCDGSVNPSDASASGGFRHMLAVAGALLRGAIRQSMQPAPRRLPQPRRSSQPAAMGSPGDARAADSA